jgi:hypothetical protein
VCNALSKLGLDCQLTPETIVNSGPGVSDGIGLEAPAITVSSPAKGSMTSSVGGGSQVLPKVALYDSGGVLAHTTTQTVEIGDGSQRENMLAVLYLFQYLPQQVPRAEIEFKGALGQTVVKTIELKNPTKRPIMYRVTLEGADEFTIADTVFRLEPESQGNFNVTFTSRFSTPVYGRLTFRSRREGGVAAAALVFVLKSLVTSRPPVQVVTCSTATYAPVLVDVDVLNPYAVDCTFKLSLIQENGSVLEAGSSAVSGSERPNTTMSRAVSRQSRRKPGGGTAAKKSVRLELCFPEPLSRSS